MVTVTKSLMLLQLVCITSSYCFKSSGSSVRVAAWPIPSDKGCVRQLGCNDRRVILRQLMTGTDDVDDIDTESFTQKQYFKEEIEAPFRKVRVFIYGGLLAAAAIGSIVTLSSLIATISGVRNGNLESIYQNLAINIGGIPVLGFLIKRDLDSQRSLLLRIQKGGNLAALKLRLFRDDSQVVVKLSDLRRDRGIEKRVIIVAAPSDLLKSSIASSMRESKSLISNDLVIVPLTIVSSPPNYDEDFTLMIQSLEQLFPDGIDIEETMHIALPIVAAQWNEVLKKEFEVALKQQRNALQTGITIIIKQNGKVGARKFGVPLWESIIGDAVTASKEAGKYSLKSVKHLVMEVVSALQYHNQMLSTELRKLQLHVCAREDAETRLNNIILSLKQSLEEIISLGANSQVPKADMGITKISMSTKIGSNTVTSRRMGTQEQSTSGWQKAYDQISSTHAQWITAIEESRRSLYAAVAVPEGTEPFLDLTTRKERGKNSDVNIRRGSTIDLGSCGILTHQILGINPPRTFENMSNATSVAYDINKDHDTLKLDLHRVHLLQRDLLSFAASITNLNSIESEAPPSHSLSSLPPSPPVYTSPMRHSSSKDTTQQKMPPDVSPQERRPSTSSMQLSGFLSTHVANDLAGLSEVALRAEDLALHLSFLAPVVPLEIQPPFSSGTSGLEALINETIAISHRKTATLTGISGGGSASSSSRVLNDNMSDAGTVSSVKTARTQQQQLQHQRDARLKGAIERARSEQQALVRFASTAKAQIKKWVNLGRNSARAFERLGSRLRGVGTKQFTGIEEVSSALRSLYGALTAAEAARITTPDATNIRKSSAHGDVGAKGVTGNSTQLKISPLDMLARGYLGPELAELVFNLRTHAENISNAEIIVNAGVKALKSDLDKEIKALAVSAEDISEAASRLAQLANNDNVIQASMPS